MSEGSFKNERIKSSTGIYFLSFCKMKEQSIKCCAMNKFVLW